MPEFRTPPSRSDTGISRVFTAFALSAALAGCAAPAGMRAISEAEPTFLRLTEERAFAQALRQRYLELATNAYDRADFTRSDFYSLRAIMAVEGKLVDPAGAGTGDTDALGAARIRLAKGLSGGARLGAPDLAARAQAAYDCWWVESQHGGDPTIAAACAGNAGAALAELEVIGTGTRLADARTSSSQPRQVVINGDTPSQTIDAGGATIQIINQPINNYGTAPTNYTDTVIATRPIGQPTQHRAVLARTVPPVEPMHSHSARTFVAEAPAPLDRSYSAPAPAPMPVETVRGTTLYSADDAAYDTVIPTVPVMDPAPTGGMYAPIDLMPSAELAPVPMIETVPVQDAPAMTGAYVPFEADRRAVSSMQPIYDDVVQGDRVAALATPVYTDTAPFAPAPVMMEQTSGDVLSTLMEARTDGRADYAVYFGFDSDEITLEAEEVLIDSLERLALEDRDTVSLMGFTDSAGDSRYNQLLAMRRANAVRKFIQEKSDRKLRFEIMPVGEAEAVENGGDGVTEALNRRVEIVVR